MNTETQNTPENAPGSSPTLVSMRSRSAWRTAFGAIIGMIGALLSWKMMAMIGDVFELPADLASLGFGSTPSPEDQARLKSATFEMNFKNAVILMGGIGGVLGGAFGLIVCVGRRLGKSSIRMMLSTVLNGAVFGLIAGGAGIWIQALARDNMAPGATSPPEQMILLMHGAIWLISGLGVGCGLLIGGSGSWRTRLEFAVILGLVGMVGGCLFPIVAGVLIPAVNSTGPIPLIDPSAGRILWLTLPALLMGLAIGRNG